MCACCQGALLLGPRYDRIKDGKFITIHGHNKPLAFLGAIVLWVGWFAFNCSSAFRSPDDRQLAIMSRSVRTRAVGA